MCGFSSYVQMLFGFLLVNILLDLQLDSDTHGYLCAFAFTAKRNERSSRTSVCVSPQINDFDDDDDKITNSKTKQKGQINY